MLKKPHTYEEVFNDIKKEVVRVAFVQVDFSEVRWKRDNDVSIIQNPNVLTTQNNYVLAKLSEHKPDLISFPELSVPHNSMQYMQSYSRSNKCIIIAGSHYRKVNGKYRSICPIFIDGNLFEIEKISPAPVSEDSAIYGSGVEAGSTIKIFKNTRVGNFSVLICSDYLNDEIKSVLPLDELDFLFVISFQRKSEWYHDKLSIDCKSSKYGIYLVYSNCYLGGQADGRSAIFGAMHKGYFNHLIERCLTNGSPEYKVLELANSIKFGICDVNVRGKRPSMPLNVKHKSNMLVHYPLSQTNESITPEKVNPSIPINSKEQKALILDHKKSKRANSNPRIGLSSAQISDFLERSRYWVLAAKSHWGLYHNSEDVKVANSVEGGLLLINSDSPLSHPEHKILNQVITYLLNAISDGGLQSVSLGINTVHCTSLALYFLEQVRIYRLKEFTTPDNIKIGSIINKLMECRSPIGWGFHLTKLSREEELRIPFVIWAMRALNLREENNNTVQEAIDEVVCNLVARSRKGFMGFKFGDSPKVTSVSLLLIFIKELNDRTLAFNILKSLDVSKLIAYVVDELSKYRFTEVEQYEVASAGLGAIEKLSWSHISVGYALEALALYPEHISKEEIRKVYKSLKVIFENNVNNSEFINLGLGDSISKSFIYPTIYFNIGLNKFHKQYGGNS